MGKQRGRERLAHIRVGLAAVVLVIMMALGHRGVFAAPALQETGMIQQLRVQVMPEFDDPRVLVIIQGRLALDAAEFPIEVTFRVPRGAQINQMASMDLSTGETKSQPYDAQPDPDDERWSLITYTLDNAHFFYEYYYNPLEGGEDKNFVFTFSSPQAVNDLLLEIQEPLAATKFSLDPPATIARFDEALGFTYHQLKVGALPADGETSVTVSYTKSDPNPSISRDQLMAMQRGADEMGTEEAEQRRSGSGGATWGYIVLLIVLVAAVAAYLLFRPDRRRTTSSLRPQSPSAPMPMSKPKLDGQQPVELDTKKVAFCSQCGTKLKAEARFCHACGVPVKRD